MTGEMSDREHDLLMHVLTEVDGIGRKTASGIITLREEFQDFEELETEDLRTVSNMNEEKAVGVYNALQDIDFTKDIAILETEIILYEFLDNAYKKLREITLEDLDINALLVKALGFTTAEEVIEFVLYQRINRSTVTSWGMRVEDIVISAGAEEIPQKENVVVGGKRFDMRKDRGGKTYYIQLKSGPNTMNVGMVDSLNQMITRIEDEHEDAVGMLGMTYGKKNQISSQIRGNLIDFENKAIIGEEFWEFVSGNENHFAELIILLNRLSTQFADRYEQRYFDLVEEKQESLRVTWREKYGSLGSEGLEQFLDEYTD